MLYLVYRGANIELLPGGGGGINDILKQNPRREMPSEELDI